jgi:hypothetical protein
MNYISCLFFVYEKPHGESNEGGQPREVQARTANTPPESSMCEPCRKVVEAHGR